MVVIIPLLRTELCIFFSSYVEALIPNVNVLGDGAFKELVTDVWKSLSHVWLFATPWTIKSMEFSRPEHWSPLIRTYRHHTHRENENTERKESCAKRAICNPNLLAPWLWTSNLKNCKKIGFCCLNHSVCCILLWDTNRLIQPLSIKHKYEIETKYNVPLIL